MSNQDQLSALFNKAKNENPQVDFEETSMRFSKSVQTLFFG